MTETAEYATQQMFVMVIMTLLGLLLQIGFLAVAVTTVRKASPEASSWLGVAAGVSIFTMIAHPVATALVPTLLGGGSESYLRSLTMLTIAFGLIGLANGCVQLLGIVRLAESRRRE
jgi:hypothetical protein